MNTIITPQEVAAIAFTDAMTFDKEDVSEAVIFAAEQKFIKPVIGELYEQIQELRYGELLNQYIKAPLALYVKLLMLPSLAANIGPTGIVQHKSKNFVAAGEKQLKALKNRTKCDADTLMKRAVEHIEQNREKYPEYEPSKNVLKKISIKGGVVLDNR